jgi:hypothetical protein
MGLLKHYLLIESATRMGVLIVLRALEHGAHPRGGTTSGPCPGTRLPWSHAHPTRLATQRFGIRMSMSNISISKQRV